jgi:Kef-type K+ transport system membrane component KefB
MPDVSFTNLLIICAVAVAAPMLVGLLPWLRIPAVVLEIVTGIVLGPSVLGWLHVDLPVQILALFGLAFLLFLAGLEIRLQDTTAEIRVRFAVVLLIGFTALAERFGLESILGAFLAGAVVGMVDRDATSHPNFRTKLEAIGYGFLVPVFFISSGVRLDLRDLLSHPAALARVALFLLALLVVRGVPALLNLRAAGPRATVAVALLQATSLPFIVTATQIGTALGQISAVTAAALVCAGLLSVLLFPPLALALLRDRPPDQPTPHPSTDRSGMIRA